MRLTHTNPNERMNNKQVPSEAWQAFFIFLNKRQQKHKKRKGHVLNSTWNNYTHQMPKRRKLQKMMIRLTTMQLFLRLLGHRPPSATPTEQVSGEYRPQKPGFEKSTNQKREISAQFRDPRKSTRKTEEINGKNTLDAKTKGDIARKTQRGHCPTNFPSRFPPRKVPQFL